MHPMKRVNPKESLVESLHVSHESMKENDDSHI